MVFFRIIFLTLFTFSIFAKTNQKKFDSNKKTICLNMIVKNEAKAIERCLASVKDKIDYWVIVDTGSTDQTQAIIKKFMKDIPGELHQSDWVNFEHNRNEALKYAKAKADYVLFIDADEQWVFEKDFHMPTLDKDCYIIEVKEATGFSYKRVGMINNRLNWAWKGVLHEDVLCKEAKTIELLKGVYNYSITQDGGRWQDPNKYLKDAKILEEALLKEPDNSRYQFYLGQSYANANHKEKAIEAYLKRASMGGCSQETFWSLYSATRLSQDLNKSDEELIKGYWQAYQVRPVRVEPLYHLIALYLKQKNYPLAYMIAKHAITIPIPDDFMFVDRNIHEWGIVLMFADAACLFGRYHEGLQAGKKCLENPSVSLEVKKIIEKNIMILEEKLNQKAS